MQVVIKRMIENQIGSSILSIKWLNGLMVGSNDFDWSVVLDLLFNGYNMCCESFQIKIHV